MSDVRAEYASRFNHVVEQFGDVVAAEYQGRDYTWSDIGRVGQVARDALGTVPHGATVAVVLRQRPWCLGAVLSVLAAGRGVLLLSPLQPDSALINDIERLAPAMVLADADDWARPGFADATAGAVGVSLHEAITGSFADRCGAGAPAAGYGSMDDDEAVGIATSGTTGPAKRYSLTWSEVRFGRRQRDPSAARGAIINALPLFSIGGVSTMVSTLFGGRPIALMDRFDVIEWAGLIRKHQPARAGAPPAVLRMMLDQGVPREWLVSVRSIYTASAPLSPALADEFERTYGIPIVQGYGATEFLGGVTGWGEDLYARYGRSKRGSVGRAIPGVKLRVVDRDSGIELARDEVGHLEVDSPRRVKGIGPGWVHTNDLARIDEDGFVWILGRTDDVIIRGGFKVHLNDVEGALAAHPDVSDACVVSLVDDRLGEVPAALVVAQSTSKSTPSEDDLVEWVKGRLAPYAVPVRVLVTDEMPMNAMLKKDRARVRALVEQAPEEVT